MTIVCVFMNMSLSVTGSIIAIFHLLLQHPVTWQPSKEGDHLIGRITLSKRSATMPKEAGALLGLKVRGHTDMQTFPRLTLCQSVSCTFLVFRANALPFFVVCLP